MANIRKRVGKKGTTYQVRYPSKSTDSGYAYKPFDTRKEAQAFIESGEARQKGACAAVSNMKVPEAVDDWLRICEEEGTDGNDPVTDCTLKNYEYYAAFMKAYEWEKPLTELTPPDIVMFRSWLLRTCPSRYVARKTLAYFKPVLGEQVLRGTIPSNVAIGIAVKAESRYDELVTVPSEEDVVALLKASDQLANAKDDRVAKAWERYRPILWVAVDAGPRPQEYLALGLPSIEKNAIVIDRAIAADGKKLSATKTPSGRRTIEVTPCTIDMLNHYAKKHYDGNAHDVLFAGNGGGLMCRRNWQRRGFNRACEQAGLMIEAEDEDTGKTVVKPKYRPYDLRHFFCSMLIEYWPNLKKIKKAAGHKNIETTLNVYGHLIDKRQDSDREYLPKEPGVIGWIL